MEIIQEHVDLLGSTKPVVYPFQKFPSHEEMRKISAPAIAIDNQVNTTAATTIGTPVLYDVSGTVTMIIDTNSLPGSYPLSVKFADAFTGSVRTRDWQPIWVRNPSIGRIATNDNGAMRFSSTVTFDYVYQTR